MTTTGLRPGGGTRDSRPAVHWARGPNAGGDARVPRRSGVALVLLCFATAAWAQSVEQCRALEFTGGDEALSCYRELLVADDPAVRAEAAWALDDFPAANAAFRSAVQANPERADLRARWGQLYLEAQSAAEALTLFREALQLDPNDIDAKLGMARVALGGFDAKAEELANEVLAAAPDRHEARLILARLALEADDPDRAQRELEGPLAAADPRIRLQAFALRAAMDHLADQVPSPWEDRALELNPRFGALHETIAHFYIITRRYREAIVELERAVAADPTLWSAHATLGMNLLRVNRFADGYGVLARAHDAFPYNREVVNALRLLDDVMGWPENVGDGLILRIDPAESGALSGYVRDLTADALDVFAARYDFRPQPPVVVELYRRHEDFAVRTSGLPGIGILGATFGHVVVMDGPSARGIDDGFDWASALWHEIAHVVTLGATDNRVARWFSEGISVLEEWQTGPSRFQVDGAPPGRHAVPPDVIDAFRDGMLLPVADLDEGFIRPRYAGQVGVSYTQAGLVCEYVAAAHGLEGLVRLLAAFADGQHTAAAIETALAVSPAALDRAFTAYLEERFADIDTAAFRAAVAEARDAAEVRDWQTAFDAAERATASYRHYVGGLSPYTVLAESAERLGRRDRAVKALTTYWQAGGRLTGPLTRLAEWRETAGDLDEALAVRRALALVAPLNGDHRVALGDRLLAAGAAADARREYVAYQALGPHDRADAHYRLARALFALDDLEAARREVLLALEIAPTYSDALRLLTDVTRRSQAGNSAR